MEDWLYYSVIVGTLIAMSSVYNKGLLDSGYNIVGIVAVKQLLACLFSFFLFMNYPQKKANKNFTDFTLNDYLKVSVSGLFTFMIIFFSFRSLETVKNTSYTNGIISALSITLSYFFALYWNKKKFSWFSLLGILMIAIGAIIIINNS
tara:strand:- start:692 stop:1135 length:444 start_codon:yes stop_codon:yes gene_type:complete